MSAILPDVAALELTYRCNHKCRFCSCPWYAGMLKPGPEMDAAEWRQLKKQLPRLRELLGGTKK